MLFVSVLVWLGNFVLSDIEAFSVWHFLNLVGYSMVIYLMSGLLFPVRGSEVTDFRAHFDVNRVRFYLLGLLFVITDAVDGLLEHFATAIPLNPWQYITLAMNFLLFVGGIRYAGSRYNGFAAILFFLGSLGWLASLVHRRILLDVSRIGICSEANCKHTCAVHRYGEFLSFATVWGVRRVDRPDICKVRSYQRLTQCCSLAWQLLRGDS